MGQLSELIQQFGGTSVEEWSEWYAKKMPEAIETATSRVFQMIRQLQSAIVLIDESMVREWVTDLVINKTFAGMKFQGAILRHLASLRGQSWKLATPDEEAQGIDGFIGGSPVSVTPTTYKSKQMLPEEIAVEMVYYEKAKDGIKITIEL